MGDDSTATTRDRLTAIEKLTDLEPRDAVTQVTLNVFHDEDGNVTDVIEQSGHPESTETARATEQPPDLE